MIKHSCVTKTTEEVIIEKVERDHIIEKYANGGFLYALKMAREGINGDHEVEMNRYQDEFTLPMKRNVFGLLTIPVYINHVLCTFIIDTGAQISGIKESKINELQLKETGHRLPVGSVGGKEKSMKGIRADSFQFGAIEYHNFPMIALKEQDFSLKFGKIDLLVFDGILGWDILSTIDFELDDIAKQMKVLKNRFRFDHPNMIMGSFPFFIVKMPDQKIGIFGFDSGSKISWIGEDAIEKFQLQIADEGTTFGFGVHGLEELDIKVISSVELYLYKAHIHLKHVGTGRVHLFAEFCFDGVLGNEIFKGRRIRFVNSKAMVLIA